MPPKFRTGHNFIKKTKPSSVAVAVAGNGKTTAKQLETGNVADHAVATATATSTSTSTATSNATATASDILTDILTDGQKTLSKKQINKKKFQKIHKGPQPEEDEELSLGGIKKKVRDTERQIAKVTEKKINEYSQWIFWCSIDSAIRFVLIRWSSSLTTTLK
jgi:hypothetical protein